MEKKYESLTLLEFQQQFPDDKSCYDYLAEMKWPGGFKCERCAHTHYCKGKLDRTRQCTKCGYQATPTSNTLFHKVKFPILKALYIVYFVATNKQGISSTELSRKLGLRQKTCQRTVVGQQEEGLRGRNNDKKKRVVVAIERKGRGIGRMYGREINDAGNQFFKPFVEDHIAPMFKAWLRGTHHAVDHLQAYLDEYTYRFNRSMMKVGIFENLLNRMVKHKPVYCENVNIY